MSLTNYYTLGITSAQQNTEKQTINHNNVSAVAASSTIITNSDTTKLASTPTTSTTTNSVTVTPSASQIENVPIITSVTVTPSASQTEHVPIITSVIVTPSASQTETVPLITSVSLTTTNQVQPVDSIITVPMAPVTVTTVVPKDNVVSSSLTSCIPSETTYSSKSGTLDVLFPVYLNSSYTQLDNEPETETEDSDWICVIS